MKVTMVGTVHSMLSEYKDEVQHFQALTDLFCVRTKNEESKHRSK